MTKDFERFTGDPDREPGLPHLPPPVLERHEKTRTYIPEPALVKAVNVALAMGQPLLVTGKPGTGKTQLAYALAAEFGLEKPQKVSVRSTTSVTDLFYEFDYLARFRDAQARRFRPLQSYLSFTGLGMAILKAAGPLADLELRDGNIFDPAAAGHEEDGAPHFPPPRKVHELFLSYVPMLRPTTSVVLIDELDKAPRDTPNDMLGWIETMSFEIKELGISVSARAGGEDEDLRHRPIVVITSNSEKSLPEAFLRRCVYFDIPFPSDGKMRDIVEKRMGAEVAAGKLLDDTLEVLQALRSDDAGIASPPGTAEYLGWLSFLVDRLGLGANDRLKGSEAGQAHMELSLGCLVKTNEDIRAARIALHEWLPKPKDTS